ncbi:MAG: response regulator [Candidatus Omnitrophota bacterium]
MALKVLSTHQIAKVCNVHHTTVINWVNEGKLKAYTTPGGHRRIRREDLVEFMKQYKFPLPRDIASDVRTVLIVDDDDDNDILHEFKEALGGNGFEIDFASSGFETGIKIYTQKPDLILLDFKMPGLNGFDVCDILKADNATKSIPIFAITVLKSDEDRKRIKDLGVTEYVPKPVDMERLLKLINKVLDLSTLSV